MAYQWLRMMSAAADALDADPNMAAGDKAFYEARERRARPPSARSVVGVDPVPGARARRDRRSRPNAGAALASGRDLA